MIKLLLVLFITHAYAVSHPEWWEAGLNIVDKHEFYNESEEIIKPKDSWQLLFAVTYADKNLTKMKDCIFYRVPGTQTGALKFKSVRIENDCHLEILNPGEREIVDIKSLNFQTRPTGFSLHFALPKYKNIKWDVNFSNAFVPVVPEMFTSSAEMKAPKIILLAPERSAPLNKDEKVSDKKICHDINHECQELSPSTCSQCSTGWYEIPNGCAQGPKYCGTIECGQKNGPACRRGIRYQRVRKKYDCSEDTSFAYCQKGLTVVCEGALAYCR